MADLCLELLLIVLVTLCAVTDLLSGTIPNGVVLPVAIAGYVLQALWKGPGRAVAILLVPAMVFIGLFPFWKMTKGKGIGAGDIKLLMAVAILAPAWSMLPICLFSFLTAGVYGMIRTLIGTIHGRIIPGIHMAVFIAAAAGLHVAGLY